MRNSLLCIFGLCLPGFAAEPAPVKATKTTSAIEFTIGDELFTRCVFGAEVAKPFLWPLNAPGEIPVTRAWPMQKGLPNETTDHVHQKSAWFCHGDVIPEGIELKVHSADKHVKGVDFWSETTGHGKIVCTDVGEVTSKDGIGRAVTKNEWQTSDGMKILDEQRIVTVRNFGDARLVVLDIDLNASVCPITFGDTKEGSMGVRVNDTFRLNGPKSDGGIVSADGSTAKAPAKDNLPMWGKRADWHDYSGTVDGKMVGIAIFDHPKNLQRAAWHTRAYGLMAANPFGRAGSGFPDVKGDTELVKIAKGDHLKLRYGILVHRGDAKESKVADIFKQFAQD
jgi:Methane oxygenase PmoA